MIWYLVIVMWSMNMTRAVNEQVPILEYRRAMPTEAACTKALAAMRIASTINSTATWNYGADGAAAFCVLGTDASLAVIKEKP
jgi:hypothetical protein